jgi:hypothetical protein
MNRWILLIFHLPGYVFQEMLMRHCSTEIYLRIFPCIRDFFVFAHYMLHTIIACLNRSIYIVPSYEEVSVSLISGAASDVLRLLPLKIPFICPGKAKYRFRLGTTHLCKQITFLVSCEFRPTLILIPTCALLRLSCGHNCVQRPLHFQFPWCFEPSPKQFASCFLFKI